MHTAHYTAVFYLDNPHLIMYVNNDPNFAPARLIQIYSFIGHYHSSVRGH